MAEMGVGFFCWTSSGEKTPLEQDGKNGGADQHQEESGSRHLAEGQGGAEAAQMFKGRFFPSPNLALFRPAHVSSWHVFAPLRLDWFVHENVKNFPEEYLTSTLEPEGYLQQATAISPQRFGKPMNRTAWFILFI